MIIPASIRNKNPGAQYPGISSRRFGSTSFETLRSKDGTHKIATFPTTVHGGAALFNLLHRVYRNMTLEKAILKWCGGYYANTYLKVLEDRAGVKRDVVLTDAFLRSEAAIGLAKAMAWQEAGREYPMIDDEWKQAHAMAFQPAVAPPFTAENDVPTPKLQTRIVKTAKVAVPAASVTGAVAAPLLPLPPVPDLGPLTAWQSVAETSQGFLTSPLLWWVVGGVAIYYVATTIVPRWAETKT